MGFGGLVLAIAPGDLFDHHTAARAMDASHPVQKENQKSPERNEFEAPLGEMIVARRRLVASGANRRGALSRPHGYLDGLFVRAEAGVLVNESSMVMAPV